MRLVCIGDVGVDHYTTLGLLKPGGIAFNVAVNALAVALDVSIVSALGTDPAGDSMVSLITDLGLSTENLRRIDGTTARQNIHVERDGERRFVGYDKGVLTRWRLGAADVAFIAAHDAIFVPLSDGMEHIFRAVAKTPGPALKAADFSLDYELADYDNDDNLLRRHCGAFDVIFFGGRPQHLPMMESLATQRPDKLFVLTLGAEGAIAFYHGERHFQLAPTVDPIDTTGCGDAFQAAFLADYLKTRHVPSALAVGASRAAVVITHLGSTTFELAS